MYVRYRIVKTDWVHPYRVQQTACWPISLIVGWQFVAPYRWHKTIEEAEADVKHRQAMDGRGAVEVARYG